ncbi:hypothetical protein P4S73_04750 [Paraglaciecola sp. Hal342]
MSNNLCSTKTMTLRGVTVSLCVEVEPVAYAAQFAGQEVARTDEALADLLLEVDGETNQLLLECVERFQSSLLRASVNSALAVLDSEKL